ncbi:unnamed protein product [Prorocentrum cordatum]|uniref:Uncharacterized protein n=1 Tax=Prorocentrum cordatum TaxID=2364126 RepID=A0ABN9XIT1_9DINO|nr:unnamed protein product [Polarella glacialis]
MDDTHGKSAASSGVQAKIRLFEPKCHGKKINSTEDDVARSVKDVMWSNMGRGVVEHQEPSTTLSDVLEHRGISMSKVPAEATLEAQASTEALVDIKSITVELRADVLCLKGAAITNETVIGCRTTSNVTGTSHAKKEHAHASPLEWVWPTGIAVVFGSGANDAEADHTLQSQFIVSGTDTMGSTIVIGNDTTDNAKGNAEDMKGDRAVDRVMANSTIDSPKVQMHGLTKAPVKATCTPLPEQDEYDDALPPQGREGYTVEFRTGD